MKTLLVEERKTLLNKGAPDDEIMRAYRLSPEELRCLYDQLIRAMADGSRYVHVGQETN